MDQTLLYAGDTLNPPRVVVSGYPPGDGWTLKYRLTPAPSNPNLQPISFDATPDGDGYLVQVGPSITSGWAAGDYGWFSWVARTGERYQVDSGQLTVAPDPATMAAGTETRSQARKVLDQLKAAYADYGATGKGLVKRYTIGTRQMEFHDAAQILTQINFWTAQVAREDTAASIDSGRGNPRRLFAAFGPPAGAWNSWYGQSGS